MEGAERVLFAEVIRCVLLCMLEALGHVLCTLEAAEDELCLLEVLEVMRCVLLRIPEAMEGALCLLGVLDVPEAMRRVLLRMLEAVECELCLLEVLDVMRCMLLCMLEAGESGLSFGVSKFPLSPFFHYAPPSLTFSVHTLCPPELPSHGIFCPSSLLSPKLTTSSKDCCHL